MTQIIYYIGLCLILPILLLLLYLENRARRIIISMIFGVLAGIASYNANNFLIEVTSMNYDVYGITLAPVIEEISKFIPILVIALIVKKGKRGSAANAFSVGVGFCVSENFLYLFQAFDQGSINVFWVIIRCIGTGLMHSMSATIIGLGIFKARNGEKFNVLYVIATLFSAIVLHMAYNFLVQDDILKFVGVFIPITLFIVFFFVLKHQEIHDFLWDKGFKEKSEDINDIE